MNYLMSFRNLIKNAIRFRSDSCLDIVDSLCSNTIYNSPVKLTLSKLFERKYSSLYKAITEFSFIQGYDLAVVANFCMRTIQQKSPTYTLICDATPVKRTAKKLNDKQYVYDATSSSPKPVAIGHNYSAVILPIKGSSTDDADWALPLDIKRIPSNENSSEFGMRQISNLINDQKLDLYNANILSIADSSYNSPSSILAVSKDLRKNLTHLCRCRGGRVCYKSSNSSINKKGHPIWFGTKLKMTKNANKMLPPDLSFTNHTKDKKGRSQKVEILIWTGMVFRGTSDFDAHSYPFSLIMISVTNSRGKNVFKNPLWLCVYGKERDQLVFSLSNKIYQIRFLIEVFFKYLKQNLLFNSFYTPHCTHEENWSTLVAIAHLQAFLCRKKTFNISFPWEYNKKRKNKNRVASLTEVQRSFCEILKKEEIHKKSPKKRGISKGRKKGTKLKPKKNSKIIRKILEDKPKNYHTDGLKQIELFGGNFQDGKRILQQKDPIKQEQKINQQSEIITNNPNSIVNIFPKNDCEHATGPPDYL